jgi:hypothetical protein
VLEPADGTLQAREGRSLAACHPGPRQACRTKNESGAKNKPARPHRVGKIEDRGEHLDQWPTIRKAIPEGFARCGSRRECASPISASASEMPIAAASQRAAIPPKVQTDKWQTASIQAAGARTPAKATHFSGAKRPVRSTATFLLREMPFRFCLWRHPTRRMWQAHAKRRGQGPSLIRCRAAKRFPARGWPGSRIREP